MSHSPGKVILRKGRSGPVWAGHPWVFSGAVQTVKGNPEHGDLVWVEDPLGNSIGQGHYSKDAHIAVRMLSLGESAIDEESFVASRIDRALASRQRLGLPSKETTAYRLVSSEGDRLPGLIVEHLGDGLVISVGSAGMLRLKDVIKSHLQGIINPQWMVFQVPKDAARLEQLPPQSLLLQGDEEDVAKTTVLENGIQFHCDPLGGQKTGYYADQRANHLYVASLVKGQKVLDAYAYGGGFGLHAAILGGASQVISVDSSARAGRLIKRNASLNGKELKIVVDDAINYLRDKAPEEQFDVIILDPPKFVRSRSHLAAGLKKYRKVNMLAMDALAPGGILVTCSCSSMVSENDFFRMLTEAGATTNKDIHILSVGGQGPDHPFLSVCAESRYLKCVIAQVQERT